ncbi:tissue factor pathway inhibitor isoform X1 [Gracilinanus agilis]|uniref:tissue factor pathway inhibitor isoform X1 n=1 Tax=Gracilinanus agilis TaxID=191870 RepID=UPI001CFE0380|nr:tissue factor pathway inhibitor isoform X1 [Gracilinanus agilis]
MITKMKKGHWLMAAVFLLISLAPWPLDANSEEEEEEGDTIEMYFPPPKLLLSSCAYKADGGPCKAMFKKFFYNIYTQRCEEFIYGGCEGNENRFESLEDCQKQCVAEYPRKTEKKKILQEKPDFCFLEQDSGICRALLLRYYYNSTSKRCEPFKYGGCLGNANNFESLEECKNICEDELDTIRVDHGEKVAVSANNNSATVKPTEVRKLFEFYGPSWCLTPADRGLCRANEKRFYFNSSIGKCRSFYYSGCGGNENNFTSKKSCLRTCKKGFSRQAKHGLIKTKRKRKKHPVKKYEKIIVEKI